MSITIIDRSNGKLILFLPALNLLQELGLPLYLHSPQSDTVEQLARLNPQIKRLESEPEKGVRIFLTDNPSAVSADHSESAIVYPIVRANRAVDLPKAWDARPLVVPVGSEQILGHVSGDPLSLVDFVRLMRSEPLLKGKRILITAGPTAEDLDPVRYLTNRSSGKMGVALARAAFTLGAQVKLVYGPGQAQIPAYLPLERVRSAEQMARAVFDHFDWCDVYIGAAAVADFTPAQVATEKIKKTEGTYRLPLKRTIDILGALGKQRTRQILVGFSVETQDTVEHSLEKLRRKHLDLIVVNNPKEKGAAFAVETNKVIVLEKNGNVHDWPLMSKFELSLKIMQLLAGIVNHER